MSLSTLRRLLAQLLSRFLNLFLPSIRRLPPQKLINHLFSFFAAIRRWTRTKISRPSFPKNQGPLIRSATLDSGIVCAMNLPSPGLSDTQEHPRPVPNSRSPSGNHLIPPISPIPRRTSNQDPLYEEPCSIDQEPQDVASILSSSSSTSIHIDHRNLTPSSDVFTQSSRPHTSPHTIIGFEAETSLGNSGIDGWAHEAHKHFDPIEFDPPRSGTPLSTKSFSQRSVSRKSHRSGISIARSSYREHHGPLGRPLTPVHDRHVPVSGPSSSPILVRAKPGVSAPPGIITAPFRTDDLIPPESALCFFPMSTNSVLRYDDRKIRPPFERDYNIKAMLYQYPDTPEGIPKGWTAYRHPEGALYFVHQQSKTFTDMNICDEDIYEDIEHFRTFLLSELENEIKEQRPTASLKIDEVQLVLEPKRNSKNGVTCCYYFVNPQTRSLFWLDEWEGHEIFKDVKGILSPSHKGLAIQAHYWWICKSHWSLYPTFCDVTQELKDEVTDMILHAASDHLTSNLSSLPLNPNELQSHLSLIERIDPEKAQRHGHHRGHYAAIMGRIMNIFYHNYFLNFHGEDCARLNFDHPVHGWRYHPSLCMAILAPLLFMTPVDNVRLLHRVFVDNTASKDKWNMFIFKLNAQLQETSVLATVLLNANVGFLPKQSGIGTSPQQYLSYMSLVASMASIFLGLVFMGHSRTEERNTPFKAAKFLHGLQHEKHGLEKLAIIYSLPHAFLMWGMVLFTVAFAAQWYCSINNTSRILVCVIMPIVTLLVAWCIWTVRDRSHFRWFQPDPDQNEYEGEGARDDHDSPAISRLGFFRRFVRSFSGRSGMSRSVSDEIPLEALDPPVLNVVTCEPSHATVASSLSDSASGGLFGYA